MSEAGRVSGAARGSWTALLALANLLGCYVGYGAVFIRPEGAWDAAAIDGIAAAAVFLCVLGTLTLLLTYVPVRRGTLPNWWLLLPAVLLLLGVARLIHVEYAYPA
ncbi:hypothetical protein H9Y04_20030 [Streptomyces sp. TRM66268-LWL]|uniref:Integral membrane protein n=1 Tax=Streptomyces polyasparticus TaxID=2767826 RepID=A0ABR7SHF5_9ACTN|nr:hypothetical protein [Streptomyces polyasparticus]MBC9714843.1 hypothetical protein [Streptomyces polyasparticus]